MALPTLALKRIDGIIFQDIMWRLYDLTESEMEVYFCLLKNQMSTVDNLATILDKDRSGIQRALEKLMEEELAKRYYRIVGKGGYAYRYEAKNFENLKKEMVELIKKSREQIDRTIEKFTLDEICQKEK